MILYSVGNLIWNKYDTRTGIVELLFISWICDHFTDAKCSQNGNIVISERMNA